MTFDEVYALVKQDLGELNPSEARTTYIKHIMTASIGYMETEGATLPHDSVVEGTTVPANYTADDASLIIMYTHYLVTKRDTTEAMPRMLRYALNNRIFKEKTNEI